MSTDKVNNSSEIWAVDGTSLLPSNFIPYCRDVLHYNEHLSLFIIHACIRAFMEVSDVHSKLGEAFGFICWLWVFHRARNDLPVVLGWRHPWEHADDPWATSDESHIENIAELQNDWDRFVVKVMKPGDGDDDEEEQEEEAEDEEEQEVEEEDD